MVYEMIPKTDNRGYDDIIEKIAWLARKYTPEWKFSPDDPDAGTALACIFARRTAETIEKFNLTPLNHRRYFYNMLGATALPAVPAWGYVQFKLSEINKECFLVNEGFKLFSPIIDEQGTRLFFETALDTWMTPACITEVIYANSTRDIICFWDEKEKPFEPSFLNNSNKRSMCFKHKLLGSLTHDCRLYMTILGADKNRWAERLSNSMNARFVQISNGEETEIGCFDEGGKMRIAAQCCNEIKAEIINIDEFEELSFGGINISFEGRDIKPDSIFTNGEHMTDSVFYAFGESPAVYDSVYIESAAALSKPEAVITIAFNIDFEIITEGEIPTPDIPNKLLVKKSDIHRPERKKITVDEVVWEYWNGTGFATIRELTDYGNIFSGIGTDGHAVKKARYELKFVCPSDISPIIVGAAQRLCIRARIKRIKNAYMIPAEIYLPRLKNICVSYKFEKPIMVSDISIVNNCEESKVTSVYPFSRLSQSALYIGLDSSARRFTLLVCRDVQSSILDEADWSFFNGSEWVRIEPLKHKRFAGFFLFELQTEPTQSTMFGKIAYWIRAELGDEENISFSGLLLNCAPVIQREKIESFCSDSVIERIQLERKNILELQIYINTAKKNQEEKWEPLQRNWTLDKAEGRICFLPTLTLVPNSRTVKLNYTCGGGAAGNLSAGGEFVPALSDGSICGVTNPFPFIGGIDSEDAVQTESRLAKELRHQNRPITKRDFEELFISKEIHSARVFADREGGLNIEISVSHETNTEDIRNRVYSKLSEVLPIGIGAVQVNVICENGRQL